jgi:hypothetical protein
MDDQIVRLRRWASRGNMPRLYTELALRLTSDGYELELQGEELTIYGHRRPSCDWCGMTDRWPFRRNLPIPRLWPSC